MTFDNVSEIGGLSIVNWSPGEAMPDPATSIPRISVEYDSEAEDWISAFRELIKLPEAEELRGLSIGLWGQPYEVTSAPIIEAVAAAAPMLPNLRAIVLGDMAYEECEVSWIQNSDAAPLFRAYPTLEHAILRGGNDLRLTGLQHAGLRTLSIQTGGMDRELLHDVLQATLPQLESLELYLGTDEYGANTEPGDLEPLLSGHVLTSVTRLGLMDYYLTDELAPLVAAAPILPRLTELDLSLGTLSDAGGQALLDSPAIARLERLNLSHHFLSDDMMARFEALGPEVDLSDQQEAEEYKGEFHRYVAIGE